MNLMKNSNLPTENNLGQPIGAPIPDWTSKSLPSATCLAGTYCRLEKLDPSKHATSLWAAYQQTNEASWTYLAIEPLTDIATVRGVLTEFSLATDAWHYAIIDNQTDQALGTFALMRADQQNGTIEMGYVIYSDLLKKTRVATEAQYLMAKYVFEDLHYRRHEWKCDHLNQPSRQAALRLGFTYEGIFRNAAVYKGRSRDTAWFSMIEEEWPARKARFEKWLSPDNFTADGTQIEKIAPLLVK